ncbi:DUF7848 domain-containing protein [Streptomyces roseolus]
MHRLRLPGAANQAVPRAERVGCNGLRGGDQEPPARSGEAAGRIPSGGDVVSTRTVMRFVTYRLQAHPDHPIAVTLRCTRPDCEWSVGPTDEDVASEACIRHRAETRHGIFASAAEGVAVVVPVDGESK